MASLLEPYVGNFAKADSASSKLDINTILAGCDAVESETPAIYNLANNVNDCAADLNADALSVDGKTITGTVDEYVQGISGVQTNINNAAEQIRDASINAYNQIQQQMNDEAYRREVDEVNRRNASVR